MTSSWEQAYADETSAPWDIGRPQVAFARLAEAGMLTGRVLDVGCGTGEHALLAAAHGADATGVDISPSAIDRAGKKATARGLPARFRIADALALECLGMTFDILMDSGVFHVFNDRDRAKYVQSLASVLAPGGMCYVLCFSDEQPRAFPPRHVGREELCRVFGNGWAVSSIHADVIHVNPFNSTSEVVRSRRNEGDIATAECASARQSDGSAARGNRLDNPIINFLAHRRKAWFASFIRE